MSADRALELIWSDTLEILATDTWIYFDLDTLPWCISPGVYLCIQGGFELIGDLEGNAISQ
jgi:hypothetical protein